MFSSSVFLVPAGLPLWLHAVLTVASRKIVCCLRANKLPAAAGKANHRQRVVITEGDSDDHINIFIFSHLYFDSWTVWISSPVEITPLRTGTFSNVIFNVLSSTFPLAP